MYIDRLYELGGTKVISRVSVLHTVYSSMSEGIATHCCLPRELLRLFYSLPVTGAKRDKFMEC